jgi:hypothetical protein
MAYFIFTKNCDNIENTLLAIVENEATLNYSSFNENNYKIIEVSQNDFNNVKYGITYPVSYNNNVVNYLNIIYSEENTNFSKKEELQNYIKQVKSRIKMFTEANPNHALFNQWNNYSNQLDALNLEEISYPLIKSLEQHLTDTGQEALHPLQIL